MKENKINKNLLETLKPPVEEILALSKKQNTNLKILDCSQAAPSSPPPQSLLAALKKSTSNPKNYRYGAVLGKSKLRILIAQRWNSLYKSDIKLSNVGVTSGCNQAFCAAITSVAKAGETVILPSPWYFNHKMWLDMQGINVAKLPCTQDFLPDFNTLKKIFNPSVKAIVLVTPNNPTGQEYPKQLIRKFANFVKRKKITLIIDETYRDFISKKSNLHELFQTHDWRKWLIHLYSFSKVYRIPGQRVGAIITGEVRLENIEKFLDTLHICPNQFSQEAAIHGLKYLTIFVENQRLEIIERRKAFKKAMMTLPNWKILGLGSYFAYIRYPMPLSSNKFSELLLKEVSILIIPGAFFEPKSDLPDNKDDRNFRVAFANIDKLSSIDLVSRLKSFESIFYEKYCFPQKTSLEGSQAK